MIDPLQSECPNCLQQPGEECDWKEVCGHPRFHAERFEVAAFAERVKNEARQTPAQADLERQAIAVVAGDMI